MVSVVQQLKFSSDRVSFAKRNTATSAEEQDTRVGRTRRTRGVELIYLFSRMIEENPNIYKFRINFFSECVLLLLLLLLHFLPTTTRRRRFVAFLPIARYRTLFSSVGR